jgi:purine-nucleoside phosphorylase
MEDILFKIQQTASYLKENAFNNIDTAVVLGTGLGSLLDLIEVKKEIPFHKIPNFPEATVEFHKGNLILASDRNKNLLIMQGRFHYYEGYGMKEITFPVRVMKELGVRNLFLSNAAGGLNPGYKKGDLVLIEDHINLLPENPLRGLNSPEFGNRFVDMYQPYDPSLNSLITESSGDLGIEIKSGVYVSVTGPNLETKAEYRFLRGCGADMVGMSTVPEVIVANQIGLSCAAVSVITDECDPDHLQPVDITEIIKIAGEADKDLSKIFLHTIRLMK